MIRSAMAVLVTLGAVLSAMHAGAQLYEGARLIPGDGAAAIESSAFLVERGLITRVGSKGEVTAAAGVPRVDLGGKTVMPALISTHVHPGFQKGLSYGAGNYTREVILNDLNLALYYGVSTVMSQGIERGDLAFQIRDEQAAGKAGGARIILGCDTGLPDHLFGYAEQRALELMAAAGMTTMQMIVAATNRGAEYLGLADRDMLAAGKRADFLLLDANPLDDIRNTRRIAKLFINGAEVDRAALQASLIR